MGGEQKQQHKYFQYYLPQCSNLTDKYIQGVGGGDY
jgi:hypothetical protein